ncbi:SCO family protein [Nocardioides montaniterrae]
MVAALVATLVLTACGGGPGGFTGRKLENPWPAPTQALTDTDGSAYSLAKDTTDKKLTLVFFGFSHCPDFCPLVMNNIAAAFNQLDAADRARTGMVFVTSDPARDTTKVLRAYLDGYNKDFIGLTAPIGKIITAASALHVYVNDGKKLPSGGYDLGGHSTFVLGLQDGKADVMWQESTSAAQFASDIHSLLKD